MRASATSKRRRPILGLLTDGKDELLVARTFPLEQAPDAQRPLIETVPSARVVLTF